MQKHVTVVGALRIGFGVLGLLIAFFVGVILIGAGVLSEDPDALGILTIIACGVGLFLVITSVPGIIGGIGLLRWKNWARVLCLILAVLDLFNIPVGTLVGIYTIWVLMQDETEQLFGARSGL